MSPQEHAHQFTFSSQLIALRRNAYFLESFTQKCQFTKPQKQSSFSPYNAAFLQN